MSFHGDEDGNYDGNKTFMIAAAIISISTIVFLASLLYGYARCIMRRRAWPRQLGINANSDSHFGELSNRGLDPSIIASLPKFVFKRPGDAKDGESGETECSVCLSSLEDGEMARKLPNCGHVFHAECIEEWLRLELTCPICRREAEPWPVLAVQPEPREGAVGVLVLPIGPTAPPPLESAATMKGTSQGSPRING